MWKVEIERLTKEVRILIGEQRNPDNDVAKDPDRRASAGVARRHVISISQDQQR